MFSDLKFFKACLKLLCFKILFPFIVELVYKNSFLEKFGSFLMLTTAFALYCFFNILKTLFLKVYYSGNIPFPSCSLFLSGI